LKKLKNYLFVLFGGLFSLVGAAFACMYVWEAVITTQGDPDQSLVFWYLPILFLGLIGILGGVALLAKGMTGLRNSG